MDFSQIHRRPIIRYLSRYSRSRRCFLNRWLKNKKFSGKQSYIGLYFFSPFFSFKGKGKGERYGKKMRKMNLSFKNIFLIPVDFFEYFGCKVQFWRHYLSKLVCWGQEIVFNNAAKFLFLREGVKITYFSRTCP